LEMASAQRRSVSAGRSCRGPILAIEKVLRAIPKKRADTVAGNKFWRVGLR